MDLEAEYYHLVADRAERQLRSLVDAIPSWSAAAKDRLDSYFDAAKKDYGQVPEEVMDDMGDDLSLIESTVGDLSASMAVQIASTGERFLGSICHTRALALPVRPNWGHKRTAVENHLHLSFDTLPGVGAITRARILANCFKHSAGMTNQEFVDLYGGALGAPIAYENENFHGMIDGTSEFLNSLAEKLR
jgi:hypothetical protein